MSYKIVEFENKEVAVVVENWLTPNKQNAYWPSIICDRLSYIRTLKRMQEADQNWSIYPVSRIFYETGISFTISLIE